MMEAFHKRIDRYFDEWRKKNPGRKKLGNEYVVNNKGERIKIRCYETNAGYIDAQTVVYMDDKIWEHYEKRGDDEASRRLAITKRGNYGCVSACGHGECEIGPHLGRRIPFENIDENLKRAVYFDIDMEEK